MVPGFVSFFPDTLEKREKYIPSKCNLGWDFDRKAGIKNEMYNHTTHTYSYACHNINVYR